MRRKSANFQFLKNKVLHHKIIFVDGIGSSGKNVLGPLLSTYNNVEIHRMDTIFEHVSALHYFGKISLEAAVTLMRYALDEYLYNGMIGRSVNFRPTDYSSVFQGLNSERYLKRLFNPEENDAVVKKIIKEKPVFQNLTHDILGFCKPCFQAFGKKLYILEMVRHPVNLVDRWLNSGWGENRYESDPSSFVLSIKAGKHCVPYYGRDVRKRYHKMKPVDRVISDISSIYFQVKRNYKLLSPECSSKVMFLKFEDFVTNSKFWMDKVAAFVGLQEGPRLSSAMAQQKCPRKLDEGDRDAMRANFERRATPAARKQLQALIHDYDKLNVEDMRRW